MNWFKHDSDAATDAKIKKIIMKHGVAGYGVYFHCLELITGNISDNNVTFELEHDAEIIADNLKIQGESGRSAVEIVEQIMRDLITLGLFEESNSRIFCFKLLKRLDTSMTSSSKLREIISSAKTNYGKIMINHDGIMENHARQDYTRQDYTIQDKKKTRQRQDNTAASGIDDILSNVATYELRDALSMWIEARKAGKSPVTANALKLAITKLQTMYPENYLNQVKCVEQTVINGWKGFFELKGNNQAAAFDPAARLAELKKQSENINKKT